MLFAMIASRVLRRKMKNEIATVRFSGTTQFKGLVCVFGALSISFFIYRRVACSHILGRERLACRPHVPFNHINVIERRTVCMQSTMLMCRFKLLFSFRINENASSAIRWWPPLRYVCVMCVRAAVVNALESLASFYSIFSFSFCLAIRDLEMHRACHDTLFDPFGRRALVQRRP